MKKHIKKTLLEEISHRMSNIAAIERELETQRTHLKAKQQEYAALEKEPKVSDHALMRLLERRYNLDLEEVRQGMLCKKVRDAMKAGATSITINDIKFVIDPKTKTIITCI